MSYNKAFIGALVVTYSGGVPEFGVQDNYVVLDHNDNLVHAPGGGVPISVFLPFEYSDSSLTMKQKVLQAIRDAYGDQHIQAVWINDLTAALNGLL